MHEWERIRSLPSEEKLEKPCKILENQDRSEIWVFLGEKQRSIEREINGNEKWIAQRLYIGEPVNLDRCKYREVSSDLSRRCRGNARRQLRCRGGIEDQLIRITNRSSIDPLGIEKLSSIQTQSWSIHQVSRCRWDCDKKKLKEARQIASYRGGVEPTFKSSFSRCEKHKHECNPTCNSTNDPINILSS